MHDIKMVRADRQTLMDNFVADENGATAIEYALIGGLLSVAIVASAIATGEGLSSVWDFIRDEVISALNR